jgi:alpha-mannosidase
MLKHPALTKARIAQFIEHELAERLLGERVPLVIEFCPKAHPTEQEARQLGPWKPTKPGFRYGPAYREVWFRLTGRVPARWKGLEVGIIAELGGERTAWLKNSPFHGIDEPHSVMPFLKEAGGNEKVDLAIQAYTRNPQCRVHRRELPREELVEEVKEASLVVVDGALKALYYDCAFAYDLMEAVDEADPAHATILRALNDCCNLFAAGRPDAIDRSRKVLRDALGSLNGELKHSLTAVGHAHLDTAWLWPLRITRLKMAHTTATQLQLIERYPEYVFVHSQASQYEWLEKQYPALFRRVKQAIAKGQWEVVGSMWVEADCNLTGGESLVRQFLYGRRYFQKHLGVTTEDMWLPDVFGYSAALPQILHKFGIRYFLTQKISWNQFNKFPHHTFWWQGIDGTKVWTHFPPADTYCGSAEPKEILRAVGNYRDHARSDASLYVFGFGDGGGGPTEKHIEFLKRARLAPNLPDVVLGRKAIDFFREARAKSRDLMTWVGELYFELHRGTYTSQAANKKANRETEFLMRDAEWLACFRDDFPASYPAAELEDAWKLVLLNQFHDIIPGSSVNEVYRDSDADYERVRQTGGEIVEESLARIARVLDSEGMKRPVALFQNATLAGQGDIAWTDDTVPASLLCGETHVPVQLVEDGFGRRIVFEVPQEALGTVAVADLSDQPPSSRKRLKAGNRRIENGEFAVRFDPHGNITSITSLDDRPVEFVEPGKLANVFQIFDDKPLFWSAWDLDVFAFETKKDLLKSESFEIVERGPVRVAAEIVKKFGNSTIRQRISLGPTPGIRFDTEIDWHEEDKLLKVAFPVNVNSPKATYEIQFGNVERPTHMNTSWDMARFEVCAQKWVDLSEGGHGVALLNDGKYGHDIHGNVMRLSLLRAPKAPDPECDMGLHRFTYVLLPHFDQIQHADVVAAAYALNAPLRWAFVEPLRGQAGELPRFVGVENRNLIVEAVKKAEDSNHLAVRLYECHNTRGTAELTCARPVRSAWLADLNERPIKELEIVDGLVVFDFKPFEIVTILLQV